MEKIRIFAFDLDGTAMRKENELSKRNKEAILKAHEQGVIMVPATGRMRTFLPPALMELGCVRYGVTSNGAVVYDYKENKVLYERAMPKETVERCLRIIEKYTVMAELYIDGSAYTEKQMWENRETVYRAPSSLFAYFLKNNKQYVLVDDLYETLRRPDVSIEKINMPFVHESVIADLRSELEQFDDIALVRSGFLNLEINDASVNKADGLRALGEVLGVSLSEMMTIGDNENDLAMLKMAGFSAAMGNAEEAIQKQASVVVASCLEDGMAEAIEKYVIKK